MNRLTQQDTVTFHVSVGTCKNQETFTFDELQLDLSDYETREQLESVLQEIYVDWSTSNCDQGYWINGDEDE